MTCQQAYLKEKSRADAAKRIAEMEKSLHEIAALKTQTMLCDPADYDFNAEDAYSAGVNNAWCDAAAIAEEAIRAGGGERD